VTANGGVRAEVGVGEPVELGVHAEVHPKAGTIVRVRWDFDGSGDYPFTHPEVDGTSSSVTLSTSHRYDQPGTYFVTAHVESHRTGDVAAVHDRIQTLGQARVVVS
jgi:hypothetical protein